MTSANALFIVNIGLASLFAMSFFGLGLAHRAQRGTVGFGVSYLVGMLTPLSEFMLPGSSVPQIFQFTSYASLLIGLLLMPLALGRFFGQRPKFGLVLAIAAVGLAGRLVLWDGPRNTMPYELLYQLPFAAATGLACAIVLRHGSRALDRGLAFTFGLVSLHFLLKPAVAMLAGSGQSARAYAGSLYALVSQAATGLLLVATGLVLLLVVFQRAILHSQAASETDPLSGLFNRRGFDRVAAATLAQAGQSGLPVTVISFDIDYFKRINDTHGHDVGDAVIVHFAQLLRRAAPAGATIARMGGEEFIVLLERASAEVAKLQAEAIRSVLNVGAAHLPHYTVSAGIAQWQAGERLRDLMRHADQALYRAKGAGRDRVHLFAPPDAARSGRRAVAAG